MPLAVFVLGFAIFAQGTSELMLAGLLPEMSRDLNVSVPTAGLLISGFALGMLIGAPILAIVTSRWPRKRALLFFVAVFVLMHVLGGLTTSYPVLFITRFLGAFVYAGFWAVAAGTAIGMVPPERRAQAMSIVAGGLTVATVAGLPLGTALGQQVGWRGAFWAVAGLSLIALLAIWRTVPNVEHAAAGNVKMELRAVRNSRLWLSYGITAASVAALLVTFGYLGAMLDDTTHIRESLVPVYLAMYGIGAVVGIVVGGRVSGHHPLRTLVIGTSGLLVSSALIAAFLASSITMVVLLILLGAFGFVTNPLLNSRVFNIAPRAPTLAPAFNVSAFNVGITVGPWVGGLALTAGLGYHALPLIGVGFAVLALGLIALDVVVLRRAQESRSQGGATTANVATSRPDPVTCH